MKNLALVLFLSAPLALAQQEASTPTLRARAQEAPVTTLRTGAKLVVVDVVVTDKDHNAVKHLKREDFTLLENKTPQTLVSFDEHTALTPGEVAKIPRMPALPPGIFTNVTAAPVNSAVNVLLLDALNTPLNDQHYVREEFLRYLKTVRPGTSIAIFGLKSRLVMLQGFSSDPDVLRKAAGQTWGHASPLLAENIGGGGAPESVADTATALGIPTLAGAAAGLNFLDNEASSVKLELRSKLTLDAINTLARYLAGIRGRKNLIWFSTSFPVDLVSGLTGGTFSNPGIDVPSGDAEYRETTNLLARSEVAVYPIAANGLEGPANFNVSNGVSLKAANPQTFGTASNGADEHSAMNLLAADTGGRAFYNVNDLGKALDEAISEGSNYYTLAYTPTNSNWKKDFRHIEVKLAEKGYQLAYRRGYYADDPDSDQSALASQPVPLVAGAGPAPAEITPLRRAMIHGVPGPTEILFKTRVLPAKGVEDHPTANNVYTPAALAQAKDGFRRYIVDFDTEGHDFSFPPAADGKFHLKAQFAALVYQPDGKLVDTVTTTLAADITEAQRAKILYGGLPFQLQVSVPVKGDYALRLGVYDFSSDHVGSVELPISSVANLAPVEAPAKTSAPRATPAPAQ